MAKHTLTTNDGRTIPLEGLDLNSPETKITGSGLFYLYAPINGPKNEVSNGLLNVMYINSNYIKMLFMPYNSNKIFVRSKVGDAKWLDWEEVTNNNVDTGWIELPLVNGATPNNQLIANGGFTSAYRTITQDGITKKMIRLNITNIAHGQTIAMLPKDFVKNLIFFGISTPRSKYLGRIALNTSGLVDFSAVGDASVWKDTDYVYGQYEWTE